MKPKARILAAALALAALASFAVPGVALAATHHRSRGAHHAAPSFPMKADEYRVLMEKRIDSVRAVIDRKLDRRGVSADRKKAIHKIFDEASKDLKAEIARATADGTVTQAEADKIKPLVIGLRGKVRERLRAEKDPAAKERLAHEDAARKEKASRDHASRKAPAEAAPDAPSDHPGKTAHAESTGAKVKAAAKPKATKAKSAKKTAHHAGGPTKTAKAPPTKRHAQAEAEPGANL